jgi:hypothetical protein
MPVSSAVRWYRSRGAIWTQAGLSAAAGVLIGGLAIAQGVIVRSDRTEIIFGLAVLLAACGLVILALRSGIGAGADYLVVRGQMGRQRLIPWPDVAGFELARPPTWNGGRAVIVVCRDGRRLYTAGCAFDPWTKKARTTAGLQMVRVLEAERQARMPTATGSPDVPSPVAEPSSIGARRGQVMNRAVRKTGAWVLWAALIFWGGFVAVSGAVGLGPALSASHGGGTKGYFVAQAESCGRNCSWQGEFRLPDGVVTRRGVTFYGDSSSLRAGSIVPALDTGGSAGVFPRKDSLQWIRPVIELVVGCVFLLLNVLFLGRLWLRRRRHRGIPGLAVSE